MKIFSVIEAEELLPTLKTNLEKIFHLNQTLKAVSADIDSLIDIWGEDVYKHNHVDNGYYTDLASKQQEVMKHLQDEMMKINQLGCFVKDIERGLVDFYYELNDEVVFLCWRYGEDKINHWHALNSGFTGRRPLRDLFAFNRQ
ncbi:MAG: DUF2203 domain-containing protein [Candidatus Aenigmarchaeota archaeon]|nr:DUF2203 domain-containing protein [Candidatus Aenigmarchaeota archaeon]